MKKKKENPYEIFVKEESVKAKLIEAAVKDFMLKRICGLIKNPYAGIRGKLQDVLDSYFKFETTVHDIKKREDGSGVVGKVAFKEITESGESLNKILEFSVKDKCKI